MPAGHATNKGQMLISCVLARSLRASPHTLPSHKAMAHGQLACVVWVAWLFTQPAMHSCLRWTLRGALGMPLRELVKPNIREVPSSPTTTAIYDR